MEAQAVSNRVSHTLKNMTDPPNRYWFILNTIDGRIF